MPHAMSPAARHQEAQLIAEFLRTKGVKRCPTRCAAGAWPGRTFEKSRPYHVSDRVSDTDDRPTVDRFTNEGPLYSAVNSGPYEK